MFIAPYDRDLLKAQFDAAQPFRWFTIHPFLNAEFAREVVEAYPSFEQSRALGFEFTRLNEQRKVQITDSAKFPTPVAKLAEQLSAPAFLTDLEFITGIPKVLADPKLEGGGMHITGCGGRLDVHVDFNFLADRALHRRLNILVYLNRDWDPAWGGAVELWDRKVERRHHALAPQFNRCVVFETSNESFHGVQPVRCPPDRARLSFAAYYYTREAPPHWQGKPYDTIFRARPDEQLRGRLLMPLERMQRRLEHGVERATERVKKLLQRA
jgi:Rps23 Pro-64 3,4-dihydroxylase Tpa1-like proline 4-hydroxylase